LLQLAISPVQGILHVTGSDRLSKFDFGRRVAREFGLDENLVAASRIGDGGLGAARASDLDVVPSDSVSAIAGEPLSVSKGLSELHCLLVAGYRSKLADLIQ
jgi:dTDP-4-dehydrorhamnose reductase